MTKLFVVLKYTRFFIFLIQLIPALSRTEYDVGSEGRGERRASVEKYFRSSFVCSTYVMGYLLFS